MPDLLDYSGELSLMGTLRTLFALGVALGHPAGGFEFSVGPRGAVQLFYVVSGFLMSYVLTEARAYSRTRDFYLSRWLRLYPIYAAVAVLSLTYQYFLNDDFFALYRQIPLSADLLLALSNIFLFGQDWVMFAAVHGGSLEFAVDFTDTDFRLHTGLLVPQAWTLGLELSFYLVAPFILHRRGLVVCLLASSLALRGVLIAAGLGLKDPWSYRFFPTELALFLFGALSHQVLLPWVRARFPDEKQLRFAANVVTFLLIAFAALYAQLPFADPVRTVLPFLVFTPLLPFAFLFQNAHPLDSRVGDLSYPLYIGHLFVQRAIEPALLTLQIAPGKASAIAGAILSLGFAYLLNKAIGNPVEAIRIRLRRVNEAAPQPHAAGNAVGRELMGETSK